MDHPTTPTLRDLYPDATSDAPLRGHTVVTSSTSSMSTRLLGRLTVLGVFGGVVCFGLAAVLDRDDAPTGSVGTAVTGATAASEPSTTGSVLLLVGGALFVLGILCGLVVARRVKHNDANDTMAPWSRWVADRGGVPATLPAAGWPRDDVRLDQACITGTERHERFGPWVVRVGTGYALVGGLADHGVRRGKSPARADTRWYVHVVLSEYAGMLFPGASVTRTGRGHEPWLHEGMTTELRLESAEVDSDAVVRVRGAADDPRWRVLFDTTVLDVLRTSLDVEFRLDGRHLTVFHGTYDGYRTEAPTERLDTMCAAAEFLARHIESIAARSAAATRANAA